VLGSSIVHLANLFGIGRIIAVGRSSARLRLTQALAPNLVETLSLEDLGSNWEETGALTTAIRDRVPAGPDAVFDFLDQGHGTAQAISSLKKDGTAIVMAPNATPLFPTATIIRNGWRIIGSRGCTRADTHRVLEWVNRGVISIDKLITHRFALADIASAVTLVRERQEPTWMVIVHPNGSSIESAG
jgi:threonine dehydrogenase-like Zn-dependent dehydrogenase